MSQRRRGCRADRPRGRTHRHLWVGTPPQKTSVIVDTGSHYAAWVCEGCWGCGSHESDPFKTSASSTYEELVGSMSQAYEEGSQWSAKKARDYVSLGDVDGTVTGYATSEGGWLEGGAVTDNFGAPGLPRAKITFGCINHQTRLFVTQTANGILGMDNVGSESFLSAFKAAGAIDELSFSLCYAPEDPESESEQYREPRGYVSDESRRRRGRIFLR